MINKICSILELLKHENSCINAYNSKVDDLRLLENNPQALHEDVLRTQNSIADLEASAKFAKNRLAIALKDIIS